MGYEVEVHGTIEFFDIEGFKKNFPFKENRNVEVGMHNDFNYFFTKVWGEELERLDYLDGQEIYFFREGKNWYNLERAMEYLSMYADAILYFQGEEEYDKYRYEISNQIINFKVGRTVWE